MSRLESRTKTDRQADETDESHTQRKREGESRMGVDKISLRCFYKVWLPARGGCEKGSKNSKARKGWVALKFWRTSFQRRGKGGLSFWRSAVDFALLSFPFLSLSPSVSVFNFVPCFPPLHFSPSVWNMTNIYICRRLSLLLLSFTLIN